MLRHDSCRSDRRAMIAANALALWARALLLLPVAANAIALSRPGLCCPSLASTVLGLGASSLVVRAVGWQHSVWWR